MSTVTTPYQRTVASRPAPLRQMLAGAAVFDAAGGVFCLAAAHQLAGWLSVPRSATYVTGALFLAAAAVGALTLRGEPVRVGGIVAANEVFALWCVVMLAADTPSTLGSVLLVVAALSSAATGFGELMIARRRTTS